MKMHSLFLLIAPALLVTAAQAQVVADSACEKHAVDIAAFATCDSATRVAKPVSDETTNAGAQEKGALEKTAAESPAVATRTAKRDDSPPRTRRAAVK